MNRRASRLAALAAGLLLVPLTAVSAAAVPPPNDTVEGALPAQIGDHVVVDTTEATTDDLDAALNLECGAPATEGSVWFVLDGTEGFLVDMGASDYTTGAIVVAGDPRDGGMLVACGPETVAVSGGMADQYFVMAFSDTPGVTGGTLDVTFAELPPAPQVSVTADPTGVAYRDGSARVSGTYSCLDAGEWDSGLDGTLVQQVGRVKITGYFGIWGLTCDGATHEWEAVVTSENGLFGGGKATSMTVAYACGAVECSVAEVQQKVRLTRGK